MSSMSSGSLITAPVAGLDYPTLCELAAGTREAAFLARLAE